MISFTINRWARAALVLLMLVGSGLTKAAIEAYEFRDEQAKEQFRELTEVLRCPKCQNQNLADSNAPIAKDMREKIHAMVEEGESTQSIVDFMVARYGDFVNYRPRRDSSTALLWYGPIVLLALGGLVVVLITRRRSRSNTTSSAPVADPERLKALLDKQDKA
ncbi:MAG TPA: cytochrome c-type biogenesis protein [Motiliproteus sp.]